MMFPIQLPPNWARISHGARGFGYDWWRTFRDETISLPTSEICTLLGTHPRARKSAKKWVHELTAAGVLVCDGDGSGVRMVDPMQGLDGGDPERTHSDPIATPKSTHSDPIATPKSTHKQTQPTEIIEPEFPLFKERKREREESAHAPPENAITPSAAQAQEFAEAYRGWCFEADVQPTVIRGRSLSAAIEQTQAVAARHRCSFAVAARRLMAAAHDRAKKTGQGVGIALRDCDVPRPVQPATPEQAESMEQYLARSERLEQFGAGHADASAHSQAIRGPLGPGNTSPATLVAIAGGKAGGGL